MKVFWCARYTELGGIQTTTNVKYFTRLKDAKIFMLNRFGYIERIKMADGRIEYKLITYCNGFTPSVEEQQLINGEFPPFVKELSTHINLKHYGLEEEHWFWSMLVNMIKKVEELHRLKSDLKQYHNIKIDTTNMDEFVKSWDDYLIKEMLDERKV